MMHTRNMEMEGVHIFDEYVCSQAGTRIMVYFKTEHFKALLNCFLLELQLNQLQQLSSDQHVEKNALRGKQKGEHVSEADVLK